MGKKQEPVSPLMKIAQKLKIAEDCVTSLSDELHYLKINIESRDGTIDRLNTSIDFHAVEITKLNRQVKELIVDNAVQVSEIIDLEQSINIIGTQRDEALDKLEIIRLVTK